jgi:N-acetyl-1-D-myo-inositol-2-amino-2-deoxy-alpha-D-glucopyranoside deacetylase
MRRLLLVHAHPDDETIWTGGTIAKYAAEGVAVTLVTCTLGEEGEVIPPELAHLAGDALGRHRIGELTAACAELGIREQLFLGGAGRWRDSGMMGTPQNDRPDCFWRADVEQATAALVEVLRRVRPDVVITYDENGGYGHPDHIQAHRVTVAAVAEVPSALWFAVGADDPRGSVVVDARDHLPAQFAAMRAHATQITVDPPRFALSNGIWHEASGIEHFTATGSHPFGGSE